MIASLKQLKKNLDARVGEDEIERDEEGRAIIEMNVLNDEDFLSDFSAGKRPVVGSEVAEFLHENAMAFLPSEPLCIKIYSNCIDEEEQKTYSGALTEYYVRHYKQNKRDLRRNSIVSLIMALIGFAVLAVVLTFSFLQKALVLSEALDIFAWVFLWEAVDLFFLERSLLRAERLRCLRFLEARIVYLPKQK